MQHLQIQFPDREDFKQLLKEVKSDIIRELKGKEQPEGKSLSVIYSTRAEIASAYRISLPTLHKHTNAGLPSHKIGKRRLYDPLEVAEYFAAKNQK